MNVTNVSDSQSLQRVNQTEPIIHEKVENESKKTEEKEPLTKEKAEEVVEGLNDFIDGTDTSLQFVFHDKLEEYYVTVVDSVTNEVVKEIPPKKLLDIYAAMAEKLGFIVDHKI
ncbi:flagellar protein FlaG [Thalassobacillus hwangdonensis]|uniref:Flagellar protein FlaG n=1 Tax=Thalassobacillus hwangdonensis TaxID=546108 RepID=A0ABW3L2L2_9BACI